MIVLTKDFYSFLFRVFNSALYKQMQDQINSQQEVITQLLNTIASCSANPSVGRCQASGGYTNGGLVTSNRTISINTTHARYEDLVATSTTTTTNTQEEATTATEVHAQKTSTGNGKFGI